MSDLSAHDTGIIRKWAGEQSSFAPVRLFPGVGDAAESLVRFCEEFQALAPGIPMIRAGSGRAPGGPAIVIGRHGNIAYRAIPAGRELQPFLEALTLAAAGAADASPQSIEAPVDVSLFIAADCPNCPGVVRQVNTLAHSNALLKVTIIDAFLFTGEAAARNIRAVPTLILDDGLRWSGSIDMAEVVRHCRERDPAGISEGSLVQLLETGQAAELAGLMAASGKLLPNFCKLLIDERWSVRLGAMATVEYLADASPWLLVELLDPLWEAFPAVSETVQGDVVHVFAQAPGEKARELLQQIAAGPYPPSVQAEAAEELQARSSTAG